MNMHITSFPISVGALPNSSVLRAEQLHRRLAVLNRDRFTPRMPSATWFTEAETRAVLLRQERVYLETERERVAPWARTAPKTPDAFVAWFKDLEKTGPGQGDPLFPWLAEQASLTEMSWFLTQEISGEAGFDDLVALTQIRMPARAKLELARNYWDEMGRGNRKGMHGPMLNVLAAALKLTPMPDTTVWEALALANTMAGLASERDYAFQSVGALGVIELTAPGRAALVAQGLKRLEIPAADRHYFDLHAVLDVKHAATWIEEVLYPLVAENPEVATAIAEGALMRLHCGMQCFERYRAEFRPGVSWTEN